MPILHASVVMQRRVYLDGQAEEIETRTAPILEPGSSTSPLCLSASRALALGCTHEGRIPLGMLPQIIVGPAEFGAYSRSA